MRRALVFWPQARSNEMKRALENEAGCPQKPISPDVANIPAMCDDT